MIDVDCANRFLVETLSTWIRVKGDQSGSQDFYLRRLESGWMVEPYEIAVANFLVGEMSDSDQSYEVGCGYGQLPFLVAWGGHHMKGIEHATARFCGAEYIRNELAKHRPEVAGRLSFCKIRFPSQFDWSHLSKSSSNTLVFTNVVATPVKEQEDTILATFTHFDSVIVMLSHFGWHRSEAEQKELERKIRDVPMQLEGAIYSGEGRRVVRYLNVARAGKAK